MKIWYFCYKQHNTHQQRLEHPLVGMWRKATCIEEPLLQNQTIGVSEVKEFKHGIQRCSSLGGCHSIYHLRSETTGKRINTTTVSSTHSSEPYIVNLQLRVNQTNSTAMQPVSKLRCSSEGGAWLQRCLAGTLQHFEDLVLGCLPNALDEGQEAARSCGFGQTCRFQLLLLGLPMFEELYRREGNGNRRSSVNNYSAEIYSINLQT